MIKLVAIDVDDTLFMTEEVTFKIENEVAVEMGHAPQKRSVHKSTFGVPTREAIAIRLPGIDVDEFHIRLKKKIADYAESGHMDSLAPENLATLEAIKNSGKKMAIVTSRDQGEVTHLIDPKHTLTEYIESFYHRDNTDFLKPDPRIFAPILERFAVSPDEAVYIGDTPNDGRCAKGAGLHFIAVLQSGLKTKEDFDGIGVDFFANKFPDILEYIHQN